MKKPLFFLALILVSCSAGHNFSQDKALFDVSAILVSYKSVADMNDAYFVIRENNFFEFYRQLFDSVKNSSYPGRYTKKGDTLLLHFYNPKGAEILGSKALIDGEKNNIRFFK